MATLAGAAADRRISWIGTPGAEAALRAVLALVVVALGAFVPIVVTSAYWLGLLVTTIGTRRRAPPSEDGAKRGFRAWRPNP